MIELLYSEWCYLSELNLPFVDLIDEVFTAVSNVSTAYKKCQRGRRQELQAIFAC